MAIRDIVNYGNPILRKKVDSIKDIDEVNKVLDDMFDSMYEADGIGLAAIQVGVPKRIIVMDISKEKDKKEPLYFVNPIIKNKNPVTATYEEGCLSVPGQFAEISRPDKCKVKYLDYNGNEKIVDTQGLLATCIQHEMDHLEGILFIDYLSKLKKSMIIKKLSKNKPDRIVV